MTAGWRNNLKHWMSFKSLGGCCGATWSLIGGDRTIIHSPVHDEDGPPPEAGMNLAMALERERNTVPVTKSLVRLIEETDGVDPGSSGGAHHDWSCCCCCVCMERSKGAAFIPCGHAFCRPCSRELWLNCGSCPVCNRSILHVLDIF